VWENLGDLVRVLLLVFVLAWSLRDVVNSPSHRNSLFNWTTIALGFYFLLIEAIKVGILEATAEIAGV